MRRQCAQDPSDAVVDFGDSVAIRAPAGGIQKRGGGVEGGVGLREGDVEKERGAFDGQFQKFKSTVSRSRRDKLFGALDQTLRERWKGGGVAR